MMDSRRSPFLLVVAAVMVVMMVGVGGDFAADRAECSDQLVGLATCLTYVQEQATAAAPTPDCCSGLKSVLQTSRKCLCVLVKDKDDPNLGLKINVTKALGLPAVCKASANISDCPGGAGANAASAGAPKKSGAAAVGLVTRWLGVGGARAAVLSIFAALVLPFLLLLG